jgi:DNA-binding cell septation regulator SpoVG
MRIEGGKDMIMPKSARKGRYRDRMCHTISSSTKIKLAMAVLRVSYDWL